MKNKVDLLIVGQGLAGTLMAFRAIQNGLSVAVIDPNISNTSSKIAAGMFTPVSGKRMAAASHAEEKLKEVFKVYRELEKLLEVSLIHELPIYQIFASVKEQNDFASRMESESFAAFINEHPNELTEVHQPFGAFEINSSGWVNLPLLLDKFKELIAREYIYLEEKLDYDLIDIAEDKVLYKHIEASKIILCEGYQAKMNPFFTDVNIIPCKGDVLTIACENAPSERIVKKGCYMVERERGQFRVGSTYKWEVEDPTPDLEGLTTLQSKLDGMLELPYQLISHTAGIRPTTHDRQPVLKVHSTYSNMFLFNGLGTKGVLNGPLWSRMMMEVVEGRGIRD